MSSITQLANRLSSGMSSLKISNTSSINIPTLNWLDSAIKPSYGLSWVQQPGSVIQALTNGAKGVYCLGVLLTDPAQALNLLKYVLQYVEAWGIGLVNELYRTCMNRVNSLLLQVYGVCVGVFKAISNLIQFMKELYQLYKNIRDLFTKKWRLKKDGWIKREDCAFFLANILRCMISRLIKPYVENFKVKATKEIDRVYTQVNDKVSNYTEPISAVSNYVQQQSMFATKFIQQINNGIF